MKIIVQNKLVETRDIVSIDESAGFRMHGFIIHLIDGASILIGRKEVYENTNSQLGEINERYRTLRKKVEEYWAKDRTDIPTLTL